MEIYSDTFIHGNEHTTEAHAQHQEEKKDTHLLPRAGDSQKARGDGEHHWGYLDRAVAAAPGTPGQRILRSAATTTSNRHTATVKRTHFA